MTTPIGLFRTHASSIDRIVRTMVGRAEMLEDLLKKLQKNAGKKGGQHYLFIGPRGIGKTYFLSLVEEGVNTRKSLTGLYTVIRFPEENNRILSFADILLEIAQDLGELEEGAEWQELHASLAAMDNDQAIVDAVVPRLRQYRQRSGRTLLLLMENLNTLFCEQLKNEQDIHRFRTFLMDSPCATLIGTSPVFFPGITSMQQPFFDFFDIQVLEDFSEELTLDLVKKNLELDQRQDLLDRLDELSPKIRALHAMTGGNPRLVMMLYELIAYDNILEVQVQFQKLLDQITPFYQDRMKDLAPQERALLETMALMRTEPRTPVAIAARMRKPPQQISSLLKRMITSGYLTVAENPKDKRSRLYRIKEGFFDLWLAMCGSRAMRKRLGYLVKLFEIWYRDRTERDKKRLELHKTLEAEQKADDARNNSLAYLDYLADIGDCDERCEAKLKLSVDYLKLGEAVKAQDLLTEVKPLTQAQGIFTWMTERAMQWADSGTGQDVEQWLDSLIEYWKIQRSGDLERAVDIAQRLGTDLSQKGLHKIRIEILQDALAYAALPGRKISLYKQIAKSQSMDGQLEKALQSLQSALHICREIGDKKSEGTSLNNISQIYHSRGDYDAALEYLRQTLAIDQEIGDNIGKCATFNNISRIYDARGDYKTALQYLQQSLTICREIGNKAGEGTALNNISGIYYARGDYNTALQYLKQSLTISRGISDKEVESTTLNNISQIFDARGDYDTALQYLKQSLKISQEIGDKAGEGTTLNNISGIYYARSDYDTALQYLKQSLAISREVSDKAGEGATLNNISQIYDARGDYDTAFKYLQQSLAISQEIGDRVREGATLNNISQIYKARGDYDNALDYLQQSLTICQGLGYRTGESATLNNISLIYKIRGDYNTALHFLHQSLAICQEIGDKAIEGATLNNIAQIYKARGDYDTALQYLHQSLTIRQTLGDKAGESVTLNNVSEIYKIRGNYDIALKYLHQSLVIRQEIGDKVGLCTTLLSIGHIYHQNDKLPQAVQAWVTVYRLARAMNLANVLNTLETLINNLNLIGGIDILERLSKQMEEEK